MSSDAETDELPQPQGALAQDLREYEAMVRESAASGQLLTAIEVARDGIARFGGNRTLKRQLALALAQTGALEAARAAVEEVIKDSAEDVDSLCVIGRVYKEMWRHASDPREARAAIQQSCKFYGAAFERDEAPYPGINLAFTLAAAGEPAKAKECAKKVAKLCRTEIAKTEGSAFGKMLEILGDKRPPKPSVTDYGWALATLGEALLHVGEIDDAAACYRKANDIFRGRWRDLASMRRQGREVLRFNQQPHEWLDRCFQFPSVVVFTGHMMDLPGRTPPRFPPEREAAVKDAIRLWLQQVRAGFGYTSGACGADLIFCECLLELEAKVNLVLPSPVDSFKRQSVNRSGTDWDRRFHHVLAHATSLTIANHAETATSAADPSSSIAFVFASRIITGLGALQAHALDLELKPLAVWDGKSGDGPGGTATTIAAWRAHGLEPHIIPPLPAPAAAAAVQPSSISPFVAQPPPAGSGLAHEIKAMLYAEIVDYAKIAERDIPAFIREFKTPLAQRIAELPARPIVAEGTGGTLTFVFDGLGEAAQLAFALRDLVGRTKWAEHGLPARLAVRVFVHAGPVFAFEDPSLGRTTCLGTHLTRASRIVRIVPPGQIYVSQEYAALCGEENTAGVNFEYLGPLPTAQLFNSAPLYRLDRAVARNVERAQ